MIKKVLQQPWFLKLMANAYVPYIGAGVRIKQVSIEEGVVEVHMPLTKLNKNFVGTQFGGSLYSMVDPFYMLLLIYKLGPSYVVWDKAASINFISPGQGRVKAVMRISNEEVETIRTLASDNKPVLRTYQVDIVADDGSVVAKVEKILYIRLKPKKTGKSDKANVEKAEAEKN